MPKTTLLQIIEENKKILDKEFWMISNHLTGEEYLEFEQFFNNAQLEILKHIVEEIENGKKYCEEDNCGCMDIENDVREKILSPIKSALKELK